MMKTIYKTFIKAVLIILGITGIKSTSYCQVSAQDPTNLVQEFNITLDKLGNAKLELTQKMDATQWAYFKQGSLYNDPAISKRDLERQMAIYDVQDFKRDLDDVNRTVKLSVTVNGYAQYKGDGQWILKLDSKSPQVTKLTDNSYMMTGNTVMGSNLVQQIYKVYFPSNATEVKPTTDEFGKAIFTYTAGKSFASYVRWNNILGVLLVLLAAYLVVKASGKPQNYNTVKAST